MLKWVNILHLHQPPHQDESVLRTITEESYSLILSLLNKYPNLKLSINISGSLIELLQEHGLQHILEGLHSYAKEGRIELLATPMYHPILPLIPQEEMRRQIDLFLDLFAKTFPGVPQPKGFFLPEMAYSKAAAEVIVEKGFSWIVLDELHAPRVVTPTTRYIVKDLPLTVLFRNRRISRHFPPEAIFEFLQFEKSDTALITAHDGELYGHWHKDDKGFYKKAFTHEHVQFFLAADYIDSLTEEETIEPKEISWETTPEDEKAGAPYALWQYPSNDIQDLMWKFAHTCLEVVKEYTNDPHFAAARKKIDRGLTSCAWWWMSGRQIGPLSPVSWHPSETKKGLDELIAGIRLLETLPTEKRKGLETEYAEVVTLIFDTHAKRQK